MRNNKKQQNLALEKKEKEVRPVVAGALVLLIAVFTVVPFLLRESKETLPDAVQTASVVTPQAMAVPKTNAVAQAVTIQGDGSVIIHDKGGTARFAPLSEKSPTPVILAPRQSTK